VEEPRLSTPEYREALVESLVRAVSRYLAVTEGPSDTVGESTVETPRQ